MSFTTEEFLREVSTALETPELPEDWRVKALEMMKRGYGVRNTAQQIAMWYIAKPPAGVL